MRVGMCLPGRQAVGSTWLSTLLTCSILQVLLMAVLTTTEVSREYCQFENFNATCGKGSVILMGHGRYGRMRVGRCVARDYGYIGCNADVLDILDHQCSGLPSCTFSIPKLQKTLQPCPKDLKTYLEVGYKCLRVSNKEDSECGSSGRYEIRSSHGHIGDSIGKWSVGTRACPLHLQSNPGQRINLTLFTFDYSAYQKDSPRRCYVYAILKDGPRMKNISLCGGLLRSKVIYSSVENSIYLYFTKNYRTGERSRFLIKYQAIGCPDVEPPAYAWAERFGDKAVVRCNHSQETWYLTCKDTTWLGTPANCTEAPPLSVQKVATQVNSFPFGLIVAVTIGIVLGIVVGTILLITVFVYKRRRRHTDACIKNNTLLDDDTCMENEDNYARRILQDYSEREGPCRQHCHLLGHQCGDYAQMMELRCSSPMLNKGIYAERRFVKRQGGGLLGETASLPVSIYPIPSSFATFKPQSGVYESSSSATCSQAKSCTLPRNADAYAPFSAGQSTDQQPDILASNLTDSNTYPERSIPKCAHQVAADNSRVRPCLHHCVSSPQVLVEKPDNPPRPT